MKKAASTPLGWVGCSPPLLKPYGYIRFFRLRYAANASTSWGGPQNRCGSSGAAAGLVERVSQFRSRSIISRPNGPPPTYQEAHWVARITHIAKAGSS